MAFTGFKEPGPLNEMVVNGVHHRGRGAARRNTGGKRPPEFGEHRSISAASTLQQLPWRRAAQGAVVVPLPARDAPSPCWVVVGAAGAAHGQVVRIGNGRPSRDRLYLHKDEGAHARRALAVSQRCGVRA